MKTEFLNAYIPRKMRAMGVGNNYLLDYRDVVVKPSSTVKFKAANMFFFFVDGFSDQVKITSDSGVYDLADENINEQKHEHSGAITIENRSERILHLEFVVVSVNNKKKNKR